MSVEPRTMVLRYPSRLDVLADAVESVEALVAQAEVSRDDAENVAICASELINNAMVHGNQLDPAKEVKIRLEIADNWVRVNVSDDGTGFDPQQVPSPVEAGNLERESGRGIFICSQLMDSVEFQRTESGGMECSLFKRFDNSSS
jgi:serine/threonine-protein kinase RsbW